MIAIHWMSQVRIEIVRKKMIKVGLAKGFTHPKTLFLSQKLDKLLNIHQQKKAECPNRHNYNKM